MKLFNEQLPFQLSDLISLKLDQDGRKVALKATLSYADGEGTPTSWVSTDPDEIADLRTICEFGDIPIEITAPAHLKPKAAAFPLPQSKVDGLHKAFIESEIPPGAGCTLHQVIAKHSNYTVSDAICNELEAVRPGHIRIGALTFRNDTDLQVKALLEPIRDGLQDLAQRLAILQGQAQLYTKQLVNGRVEEQKRAAAEKRKRKREADLANKRQQEAEQIDVEASMKLMAAKKRSKTAGRRRPR